VIKVKIRENLTDVEANVVEIALIAAIGREHEGGPLINQTRGGDGRTGISPEAAAKQSEKLRGRASPLKGRKLTGHHLAQVQLILVKARKFGVMSNTGKKRSASTKQKMSLKKEGRVWMNDGQKSFLVPPFGPFQENFTYGRIPPAYTKKAGRPRGSLDTKPRVYRAHPRLLTLVDDQLFSGNGGVPYAGPAR